MSNISPIYRKDYDYLIKEKIVNFLGSPDFVNFLEKSNISDIYFNELFIAHLLTIGFQSTGIKEGGIKLSYFIEKNPDTEMYDFQPNIQFYFYTTNYKIIQNFGSYSNTTSLKIHNNKHDFKYRDSRSLREFMSQYSKQMKIFLNQKRDYYKRLYNKSLPNEYSFKKNTTCTIKKNENFYDSVIGSCPNLEAILVRYFIEEEINLNKSSNLAKKHKI